MNSSGVTPVTEENVKQELLEPRLRRIVADLLGVDPEALAPQVSLTDDLAADSLDLVEVALEIESHLGIEIPERTIAKIRTYGELVQAALAHAETGEVKAPEETAPAPLVFSRVVRAGGDPALPLVERAGKLTPYVVQNITEDALWAGRGASLEVTVQATANEASVALVMDQFAWLGERGVKVRVRRDADRPAPPP